MKAVEIFQSIVDNVVQQAASGVWYLEPLWMLEPGVPVDDAECMAQVRDMLELAVKKKNAEGDLVHPVVDWLYKLMTEEGQYALSDTEMRLVEGMLDFVNQSHNLGNEKMQLPASWDFSKKG